MTSSNTNQEDTMEHKPGCPVTITTASRGGAIIILTKCPCYTAPEWNQSGVVKRE